MATAMKYCESIYKTKRRKTREVMVGNVGVGGDNPLRIQSMTTSSTRDVEGTIEQIVKLADVGCEIARVTVQGKKEAEACEHIKNGLVKRGYDIPLVADIHFYPPAAMLVADFVDKVRVNPGNYVDRRASFKTIEYDDESYSKEIERIEEGFAPLVLKCKKRGIAMRIGTNHGSLSDRIMSRYGDTPFGMTESALEFTRVCRKYDFHDIIFSMKASNPFVMIQAYRLLCAKMYELGWDYPLHLGVTEAGDGEDGRVKSAIGSGSLLLDGLGDTVRVSLTEDPWEEIGPCSELRDFYEERLGKGLSPFTESYRHFDEIIRRPVVTCPPLHRDGSVMTVSADGIFAEDGQRVPNEMIVSACQDSYPVAPYIVLKLGENPVHEARRFYERLRASGSRAPVILYPTKKTDIITTSAEMGALLSDGIGEGLALDNPKLAFTILQGCRMRATRTEFIACPGCGRTLFNLQEVTQRIRAKTGHLPGVKIAVMGCIVNGPGEMADADFGYVGSRTGKIDLYVGKTCVEKNIDESDADERLIDLIKAHGRWQQATVVK